MPITLKSVDQIEAIRRAGRIVGKVLAELGPMVVPGVSTGELDAEAERICQAEGGTCLFKGVPGRGGAGPFPGNICASVNEEIVHGIPSRSRKVREGDILSVDFGVKLDGWCGDAARTYAVGAVDAESRRLMDVTATSLDIAIKMIKPGQRWSTIARAMQEYVEGEGFAVVRDFVGHGIGTEMHEDPQIPNFVSRQLELRDIVLAEGMVLAVEPMVNAGSASVAYLSDGWTAVTRDRKRSAHYEHTLAVTSDGVSVLTAYEE